MRPATGRRQLACQSGSGQTLPAPAFLGMGREQEGPQRQPEGLRTGPAQKECLSSGRNHGASCRENAFPLWKIFRHLPEVQRIDPRGHTHPCTGLFPRSSEANGPKVLLGERSICGGGRREGFPAAFASSGQPAGPGPSHLVFTKARQGPWCCPSYRCGN